MARVEDAREAEAIVCSYYPNITDPQPYKFKTHKQGYTWIVKFRLLTVGDSEE